MMAQTSKEDDNALARKRLSLKTSYKRPPDYKLIKRVSLALIILIIILYLYIPYFNQPSQQHASLQVFLHPQEKRIQGLQFSARTQEYISQYCKKDQGECRREDLGHINEVLILIESFKQEAINERSLNTIQKEEQAEQEQEKQKYIQQIRLFVVKNEKMTTPMMREQTLLQFIKSKLMYENRYENIDQIVGENEDNLLWETNKRFSMFSVRSSAMISPYLIQIEIVSDAEQELSLLGLAFGPLNQIMGVNLGKYVLREGVNKLRCLGQHCKERYPMIMMVITNIKLKRVKIYSYKQ